MHATVSFTAESVVIVRGTLHQPEVEYFRQRYAAPPAYGATKWEEDSGLAAQIGAVLVVGHPEQLQKFRARLAKAQADFVRPA